MVNSHLVCNPTIRQPGFDLPWQHWSLLNRFHTEQGHPDACRRKWRLTDTDLCPRGETQTMSCTVESFPLTKLNGGLFRLHSADEDACFLADQLWFMHIRRRRRLLWHCRLDMLNGIWPVKNTLTLQPVIFNNEILCVVNILLLSQNRQNHF